LKRPAATKYNKTDFPKRIGPVFRTGAFCSSFLKWNLCPLPHLFRPYRRKKAMLVERGLRVMNMEVVGDAYASNYLRRSGVIPDSSATNERLLQIIVEMFQRGEFNRIRLANKAIARFDACELV
jgi:hypothetical protein